MTKNSTTVLVTDEFGNKKGTTYPKRARGLIKHGRAHQVNDSEIRLVSPTYITEDNKMENILNKEPVNITAENAPLTIYFNPREWSFNPDCKQSNKGERSFITDFDGNLVEAYTIGNWRWDWTEITTQPLQLPKEMSCKFIFWLNGGENDNNDEVCQLNVIFDGDYENRLIYKLNRNFIKPLKKLDGWELYEIPFNTGNANNTVIRFVSQKAPMTIMPAKDKETYKDVADRVDEFADERTQRHNIIFEDGWPTNTWYATKKLKAKRDGTSENTDSTSGSSPFGNGFNNFNFDEFKESLANCVDIDEIRDEIADGLDIESIADEIKDQMLASINLDELRETIKATVMNTMNFGDTGEN